MLDLIEMTNREVCVLMAMAFAMGFLFGVVLFYIPLKAKLDTIKRNADREERCKRSARAGEYMSIHDKNHDFYKSGLAMKKGIERTKMLLESRLRNKRYRKI